MDAVSQSLFFDALVAGARALRKPLTGLGAGAGCTSLPPHQKPFPLDSTKASSFKGESNYVTEGRKTTGAHSENKIGGEGKEGGGKKGRERKPKKEKGREKEREGERRRRDTW